MMNLAKCKNKKLTTRDLKVPELVKEYKLLTTRQIKELLYPSLQKAQTRLKAVYKAGLVKRYAYPVLLKEGGKGEFVYHVGKKPKLVYSKVLHTIELNKIRIAFEKACEQSENIKLIDFLPEYKGKVEKGKIKRLVEQEVSLPDGIGKTTLIPDAVICLENKRTKKKGMFYLEVDLGTEKIITGNKDKYSLLKKMMVYKEYVKGEKYKKYNSVNYYDYDFRGIRVLSVMDSTTRIRSLRRELFNKGIKKFIWLTESSEISTSTVFSKIWLMANIDDNNKYSIIGK